MKYAILNIHGNIYAIEISKLEDVDSIKILSGTDNYHLIKASLGSNYFIVSDKYLERHITKQEIKPSEKGGIIIETSERQSHRNDIIDVEREELSEIFMLSSTPNGETCDYIIETDDPESFKLYYELMLTKKDALNSDYYEEDEENWEDN